MLQTLLIKNYALIDELSVTFDRGLNIITGETGAGKSIVVDALSLILGERADPGAVRKGAEKAIVEATFGAAGNRALRELLAAREIDWSDELILRREVAARGQGRAFVNDTPAPAAVLKEIGDLLVDLHGQHEHQSLLRPETHVDLVDDFGGLKGLVDEFAAAHRIARATIAALRDLRSKERDLMDRRALVAFQVGEIDAVAPQAGEEEALEGELMILENAEKLHAATERLYALLYEGEQAVHDQLVLARNELASLAAIDPAFEEQAAEAESAAAITGELAKFVQRYNSRIEFNPERLEEIRTRLGRLSLLKKKYGGSLDSVLAHRAEAGRALALADNFEGEIAALVKRLADERSAASRIAMRLSAKRRETAEKVNGAVIRALAQLGIPSARFDTSIDLRPAASPDEAVVVRGKEYLESTPRGADVVEFRVATNPGEDIRPLAKVASGGEISRIMLAMKMTLAKSERLPLLIFDEIDVGVSGRIAQAVGAAMKKLSRFHQVIAITHLPQIAGLGDSHFVVEKIKENGRNLTQMRKLSGEERVVEVAALLSGSEVTESGRASARELMGLANT